MHAHRSSDPMLAAVLLIGAALLSVSPASARTWNQRFEAGDSADVQVRTDDANVRIRTRESGPVEIEVKHDAKTWGWVHGKREPQVSIRREGRTVVVEAMTPDEMVVLGGYVLDFSITLTMPRHGRLSVRTEDGRIECDPFTGDVRLEASDGAILGTGLAGHVDLRSGDGRIVASGLDGDVQARTADGRLDLTGRFERLDARTGDGRAAVTATAGSRLAGPWAVETGEGSVTLRVPRDLAAMLDARTSDGRIVVELPIPVPPRTRQVLTGQLNGGIEPLRVRTGDGRITLALSTP